MPGTLIRCKGFANRTSSWKARWLSWIWHLTQWCVRTNRRQAVSSRDPLPMTHPSPTIRTRCSEAHRHNFSSSLTSNQRSIGVLMIYLTIRTMRSQGFPIRSLRYKKSWVRSHLLAAALSARPIIFTAVHEQALSMALIALWQSSKTSLSIHKEQTKNCKRRSNFYRKYSFDRATHLNKWTTKVTLRSMYRVWCQTLKFRRNRLSGLKASWNMLSVIIKELMKTW